MIVAAVLAAAVFVPALFIDADELERHAPPPSVVPPPNFRDLPQPPANQPANTQAAPPTDTPRSNDPAGRLPTSPGETPAPPPGNQPDAS